MCRWSNLGVFCKSTIIERRFGITYQTGKYFKINEKWVINKMLNYFSSSTVFGVIRLSYSECNHNVTEIARFSKGDFGNVHCNTESVDSNTDWTQVWFTLYQDNKTFCQKQTNSSINCKKNMCFKNSTMYTFLCKVTVWN